MPNRHSALDLAARLPPLLVAAGRVASSVAHGHHGRRRAGPGEVFWQFRHAQPGDPASAVDWRQSARSDHLFLRETEWAAARTVWLWRDGSASMDWRSAPHLPTKRDRAELLILALAALLLKGGERVALLSGALGPVSGSGALNRLADGLTLADGDPPMLSPASHLVLAGDFLAPLEETAERLSRLEGRGHLLQVLDPAEEDLPYHGRIRFEGTEGEGTLLARRAEDLRDGYARRLAAHQDGLRRIAGDRGWGFSTHATHQPPQLALLALHAALAEARP